MHLSTIFVKLTISKNTSVKTNFYRLGSQTLQNTKKKKKEINPRNTLSHFPSSPPLPPALKTVPSIVREERVHFPFRGKPISNPRFQSGNHQTSPTSGCALH